MTTRRCAGCETELQPNRSNPRKWCSEACRISTYRKTNAEYRASSKVAGKARKEREKAARRAAAPPRQCVQCGGSITSLHPGHKTCGSEDCIRLRINANMREYMRANPDKRTTDAIRNLRSRQRAKRRNAFVADVDRQQIFERDGWKCHLCGKKIDPNSHFPDLLCATIDHVIPIALGGTHEPANVAAAHFLCNSRKGARGGGEQLAII